MGNKCGRSTNVGVSRPSGAQNGGKCSVSGPAGGRKGSGSKSTLGSSDVSRNSTGTGRLSAFKFTDTGYDVTAPKRWDDQVLAALLGGKPTNLQDAVGIPVQGGLVERGPVSLPDGSVYCGQWKGNLRHGKGQYFGIDGTQYIGAFVDDAYHGQGELRMWNGDKYQGLFKNGKYNGKGIFTQHNGDIYEGVFVQGRREGFGTERYRDGSVYMGQFKNNKRMGHGELKLADGILYEGDFNDEITGKGKMYWPTGECYVGGFLNGLKHGLGETTWKVGPMASQRGRYQDGKMCGTFENVMRDGKVIKGVYKDGVLLQEIQDEAATKTVGGLGARQSRGQANSGRINYVNATPRNSTPNMGEQLNASPRNFQRSKSSVVTPRKSATLSARERIPSSPSSTAGY